jgi:glycosyltransferase involved in cell wall biosynthesis
VHVVYISKACVVGSYQTKLEELARQPGIELTAIVPPAWRDGARVQRLERLHTQGYRLLVAPIVANGSFHLHFYPTLGRLLASLRPDLCHIDEEPYNLATYLALQAALRVGARALFFTWQNLVRRYPWPFSALEQAVYRGVSGALAGNQDAVDVLRAKGYAGPVRVAPQFGVDPEYFRPDPELCATEHPFTVGFAGRLEEYKGLPTLAEALVGLGGDWRALLVGQGPWGPRFVAELDAAGLGARVEQRGHVPSGEMPTVLRRMDVLVLPSRTRPNWQEQFGRVLIEAMACGVPVVGSDSGEIPNVIGPAGLVFPEGDAEALRQALSRLRDDSALRARLSSQGRARVLGQYTQAQVAAQTAAFYREIMAR